MADLVSDPLAWRATKAPSLAEFEVLAGDVFRRLPQRFRDLAADVVIRIDDFPTDEVLDEPPPGIEARPGFFADAGGNFKSSSVALGPCNHSSSGAIADPTPTDLMYQRVAQITGADPMRMNSTLETSVRASRSCSRSIMAIIGGTAVSQVQR